MPIAEDIVREIKTCMKGGDKERLSVMRMLRSKLLEAEVAARAKRGRDAQLTDDEATAVIASYAKQRRDAIDAYRQGGRDDLAEKEQRELDICSTLLPEPLDEEALAAIVEEAIAASGASGPGDMGKVMKLVMPRVAGRADGKAVNASVRKLLS